MSIYFGGFEGSSGSTVSSCRAAGGGAVVDGGFTASTGRLEMEGPSFLVESYGIMSRRAIDNGTNGVARCSGSAEVNGGDSRTVESRNDTGNAVANATTVYRSLPFHRRVLVSGGTVIINRGGTSSLTPAAVLATVCEGTFYGGSTTDCVERSTPGFASGWI